MNTEILTGGLMSPLKRTCCAIGKPLAMLPDLPVRLQNDIPLTPPDQSTFYKPGNLRPRGYSDWPFANGNR
ncbi:hypothetical protein L210DRAFT_2453671 [Boletus edulis BED1]|uniref:Uncharacterized protein n=1 Tax=Boletus edulis BED1 TaxID=1328754 RepID=A0AAD4BQ67_BOLED|nr:hypothetical protein L210DRAFT_2453671 [Boletus edulis BED1]